MKMSLADLGGLVYSTESGRMCPGCRQPVAQCICQQNKPLPTGDGIVRVSRETKGRGGKAVTLVKGVLVDEARFADDEINLRAQVERLAPAGGKPLADFRAQPVTPRRQRPGAEFANAAVIIGDAAGNQLAFALQRNLYALRRSAGGDIQNMGA